MSGLTPDQIAHYHDSKQPTIIAVFTICLVLCNLAVAGRICAQLRLSRRLYLDDYTLVFALICQNITGALYLYSVHNGLGLHLYRVIADDPHPPDKLVTFFRALYLNSVFIGPLLFSVKFSLLWFYRRTFLVAQRWASIFWWINLVYIVLWAVGSTFFYIFQCIPPDYYWRRLYIEFEVPGSSSIVGSCNASSSVDVGMPLVLSLVSDISVWLLPVVTLSGLQLPLKKKIGLVFIFSIGLLACICAVGRTWLEFGIDPLQDPTYLVVGFILFTFCEGGLAIIAACAPLLPSQWQWMVQKTHSIYVSTTTSSTIAMKETMSKGFSPGQSGRSSRYESTVGTGDRERVSINDSVTELGKGQIRVTREFDVEWNRALTPQ